MIFPRVSSILSEGCCRMGRTKIAVLTIVAGLCATPLVLVSQQDRIGAKVDPARAVAVKGNVHVYARAQYDLGPTDPARRMHLVTLMLKPTSAQ